MADRVHPADAINYPAVPTAPPASTLVKHQQQAPPPARKDVVYKTPLPLPATHPSNRRGRRRNPCCCCLMWICATLATVVILLGIAALVIYLVFQPRGPHYSVQDVHISQFNVTNKPLLSGTVASAADAPYLNSDILFTIKARNPNKKIGISYNDIQVTLLYEDVKIGMGSIAPFYQGHKNTTLLSLRLQGEDVALRQTVGSTLSKALSDKSNIPLEAKTVAHVRIKVGSWRSPSVKVKVECKVEMTPPRSGNARLLSESCKLKM